METAYQAFGRMLKSGDLDGVTSFHLLESDIDNFAYCAAYALQDQVRGVSFDTVKRAIEKGQLTLSGVSIRRARLSRPDPRGAYRSPRWTWP